MYHLHWMIRGTSEHLLSSRRDSNGTYVAFFFFPTVPQGDIQVSVVELTYK